MKRNLLYSQLTALIFTAAFFTQTFNKLFVVADYYTNTSKYAQNCENKATPQMRCNGKCQMMKKLQQEEKKDQENPGRKSDNKNEITLFSKSFFATAHFYKFYCIKNQYAFFKTPKLTGRPSKVFHPPALSIAAS